MIGLIIALWVLSGALGVYLGNTYANMPLKSWGDGLFAAFIGVAFGPMVFVLGSIVAIEASGIMNRPLPWVKE